MKATALLLAAPLLAACSGVDTNATTHVTGPAFGTDGASFRPVSAVMEQRCGTLDCHGSLPRPLRIYGRYGLRSPVNDASSDYFGWDLPTSVCSPMAVADAGADAGGSYPGGSLPTTCYELLANFQSMCALEPEKLKQVVSKQADPETLTLVRKPRLAEKHKGGLVWNKGDDGDVCLVNWLTGVDDTTTCTTELMHR